MTLGTMVSRISRELRRDGLTADIKDSIVSAIDFYSPDRFWFNEGESTAHIGSGIVSVSYPTNFRDIDTVELSSTSTDRIELSLRSIEEIRRINSSPEVKGIPDRYATFRERIFFGTRPDRAFEIKVFGHVDLTGISSSASNGVTNAWMVEGEALIRSRAKSNVARHRLRNYELADRMDVEAIRIRSRLLDTTTDKIATGRIKKTRF